MYHASPNTSLLFQSVPTCSITAQSTNSHFLFLHYSIDFAVFVAVIPHYEISLYCVHVALLYGLTQCLMYIILHTCSSTVWFNTLFNVHYKVASQVAALDLGYKTGVDNMTEKPKLLFLLGAVSTDHLFSTFVLLLLFPCY